MKDYDQNSFSYFEFHKKSLEVFKKQMPYPTII